MVKVSINKRQNDERKDDEKKDGGVTTLMKDSACH